MTGTCGLLTAEGYAAQYPCQCQTDAPPTPVESPATALSTQCTSRMVPCFVRPSLRRWQGGGKCGSMTLKLSSHPGGTLRDARELPDPPPLDGPMHQQDGCLLCESEIVFYCLRC